MGTGARIWTSTDNLLDVIADALLDLVRLFPDVATLPPLADVTVLVPTRRAARLLEHVLHARSGRRALILPRIHPIGDVDEDLVAEDLAGLGVLPDALSATGLLFEVQGLIALWAARNPHLPLAQDVATSPSQALGLAKSLVEFVTQAETEEVDLMIGADMLGLDLAEHRASVLSLLDLVAVDLPKRLMDGKVMTAARRRNRLISLEAERLLAMPPRGPVIAVGSTGTNPATRQLLKAILHLPLGAIVLPGLDTGMDDETWNAVGPEHPQYAMKMLLATLEQPRSIVRDLAPVRPRATLLREVTRPATTTEHWHDNPVLAGLDLAGALDGVQLISAPDRHMEARAIAVLFREVLEAPGRTAALVTPDRDLARRVAAELSRWNITIDDSAGMPLLRAGRAHVLDVLMQVLESDFAPDVLVALMHHPLVTLGLTGEEARRAARLFEAVALRTDVPLRQPATFVARLAALRAVLAKDRHAHPMIAAMDDVEWALLENHVARLAAALQPLLATGTPDLARHVDALHIALDTLAPPGAALDDIDDALLGVLDEVRQHAARHPVCTLSAALPILRHCLKAETLRPHLRGDPPLAIYGLAEARMITADVVVMGGLTEMAWPAAVDPGPWVNRGMRRTLGLQVPERDIGITAHDFVQGFVHRQLVLSWCRRKGTEPASPSRWLLRLEALLSAAKVEIAACPALSWALAMDAPRTTPAPLAAPAPRPDVAIRPTRFSVTEIETLRRDPYAIYARKILRLSPLAALGLALEPRLKGILFHAALSDWIERCKADRTVSREAHLVAAGEAVFDLFRGELVIEKFWWPAFRRMARQLVQDETGNGDDTEAQLVEQGASLKFPVLGIDHMLTARADRIDVLQGRRARIIDYKTGALPTDKQVESGLSPQMTLEGALLLHGGFAREVPTTLDDLVYIKIGSGLTACTVRRVTKRGDVDALAREHLAGLQRLLALFQNPAQAYPPRLIVKEEKRVLDFDHLSRFKEWALDDA